MNKNHKESIARLRDALEYPDAVLGETTDVRTDDLRALLDAYDTAQAQAGMTSAVVSAVRITTDVTSLPHVNERVATLCAEYGVSTQQPPDRLIVELLNAVNETAVVAMDDARKYLIERDAARAAWHRHSAVERVWRAPASRRRGEHDKEEIKNEN